MGSRIRNDRLSDAAGSGPAFSGSEKPVSAGLAGFSRAVRAILRLLILLLSLVEVALRFAVLRFRRGSRLELRDRARWLHAACGMILRRLRIAVEWRGARPTQGLVCSNHLSYLDILVYAAAMPCIFVSKREVARWPGFGFFARAGGSIFVDRQSRGSTDAVVGQIAGALDAGVPVLLFPEGTSTDGSAVLRFHPSLLEPATRMGVEMTAAAIGYQVRCATEREICWYGDAAFTPHLLRTMGHAGLMAEVEFYPERGVYGDRKAAALELRERVEALRKRMGRETAG